MKPQSIEALGAIPLATPGELLGDLAHDALDQIIADFRRPAYRAGLGASVLTAAVLARLGTRASVAVAVSVLAGLSVERLFQMAEDVHEKLTADANREV